MALLTKTRGFTITEIIITVIIMAAIAAFAIPSYQRAIEQAHLRDSIAQLKSMHAANQIYKTTTDTDDYWPPDAGPYNLADINTDLGLNIIANGMTYTCVGTDGSAYTCTAVRQSASPFTVTLTEDPLSAANPACTAGACP